MVGLPLMSRVHILSKGYCPWTAEGHKQTCERIRRWCEKDHVRSVPWGCSVQYSTVLQYRTVMQRYDAHLSQNTLRVLSLTRCDRVGQLFSSIEFLRTLPVREVIIPTYELASVGKNQCCRFCDLSCADFPRTNSIWSHLTCEWRQLLCFLHVFWHVEIIFFTTILDTFSV